MRHIRLPAATILTFLAIEFLDELAGGVGSAAWPLVRNDLNLTYVQIGLLLRNYLKMASRHWRRNHRSAHASCSNPM